MYLTSASRLLIGKFSTGNKVVYNDFQKSLAQQGFSLCLLKLFFIFLKLTDIMVKDESGGRIWKKLKQKETMELTFCAFLQ